ncbi:methyltransferase domain-containing protein [Gluconacetobacter azotocaptans]|uniref:Methyltransferase domain-containing protein n=1 Tax=Gluconacetobacter azotocaptans TaxID=142834 RepID=A0A7W4JU21_9PROT|nr:methyltransferase domain-containing protein [Gluconacetobacter azotocaptans]MBB2190894.1 methyltransferase domain-containing protein [Gluconacetobacter azotocaptans]GBQ31673.1 methyltransferase [Gluconacetobacter azotocaptans DSM 13594]
MNDSVIFDRRAVRQHRDRAARQVGSVTAILDEVAERLLDRLDDTTYRFAAALDIGGRGVVAPRLRGRGIDSVISCDLAPEMARLNGTPCLCADEEWLPFGPGAFDLVVANLSLHWVNDLPGALAQIRHALKPDGLFLASLPVLPSLSGLRHALTDAECALLGGASPRVSPFPDLRDCASLLQRAGFALPVADADTILLDYRTPMGLLRDLRAAGETNALTLRSRRFAPISLFPAALADLASSEGESLAVPLRLAIMTGWAPDAAQPKPLRPGQFTTPLEDALKNIK